MWYRLLYLRFLIKSMNFGIFFVYRIFKMKKLNEMNKIFTGTFTGIKIVKI